MGVKFKPSIPSSKITPPSVFFGRRKFLASFGIGILATPSVFCGNNRAQTEQPQDSPLESLLEPPLSRPDVFPALTNQNFKVPFSITRKALTPRTVAASHNNFYEFLPGTGGPVWRDTGDFEVDPWTVEVTGECHNPTTFDLDDLFAFEHEERVYHFRCVERWAMNVPWAGFPLKSLLKKVEPKNSATHIRFVSANRPDQMPGIRSASYYPWPYHEALRLDEAMNDLTLLVTGVYGEPLLKQHGAPIRLAVPWKYGYKSPKSIVKIELLTKEPSTFWQMQPHEYGFLSNVNPNIPHPRWSQAHSYWLDTREMFDTPLFNGYDDYVADLYPNEPRKLQSPLAKGSIAR